MDIYFRPEYGQLYEQHEKGLLEQFEYKKPYGSVYYQFIRRPIPTLVGGVQYYDITTPYGYGGPVIVDCDEKKKNELASEFYSALKTYCEQNRIVSEFIRFHPIERNHEAFSSLYEIDCIRKTVSIDLRGDFFTDEYSSSCRNKIRKSKKHEITIQRDENGDYIPQFIDLYNKTMKKNNASQYYFFEYNYFNKLISTLKDRFFFLHASYDGQLISSALFLIGVKYLHYHLSGNDPKYITMSANQLILYYAGKWGQENGKERLHLGGGATSSLDDPLLSFKKSFSRGPLHDFYVGKKVINRQIYDTLNHSVLEDSRYDANYFPPYRSVV